MSEDVIASSSTADTSSVLSSNRNEITLGNLADAFEVLQGFANEPLDGVTAAKIVRLTRWARAHYARYVAARQTEAEKYGEKIADGKIKISGQAIAPFTKAITPIRAEIITIDPMMKIDVKTMGSVKISPLVLEILEPFLNGI